MIYNPPLQPFGRTTMAQKRLYFAYGENMNLGRLKKWLFQRGGRPDGIVMTQRAELKGYSLVFNVHREIPWKAGVANLVEDPKGCVEGVLMEIDPSIDNLVQKKEAYPAASKRVEVTVTGDQEKEYDRVTLYVSTRAEEGKVLSPSKAYMKLLLDAAEDFGFSKAAVGAMKKIKTVD